jgi:Ca-activated chloride channel family protein
MKKGIVLKRKIVSLLIAFVLVLGIVGCGSKEKSEDKSFAQTKEENSSTEYATSTQPKNDNKEEPQKESEWLSVKESASDNYGGANQEVKIGNNEVLYTLDGNEDEAKTETFDLHDFETATLNSVSTFSVDVDTASYSMVRNHLEGDRMPYQEDVRIEEMINYFKYDYETPKTEPFSINTELGVCPWDDDYLIASIGLNGKEIELDERASTNLVFLMDVSGSMNDEDKLPLLKESFKLLVDELGENDRVSIVVYAGASGAVLEGARGNDKDEIMRAIDRLEAGGSTAGSEGIQMAYKLADKYFIPNGNNRVILATDGDFNVGLTSENELLEFIEDKREEGVFLSALGFGENSRNFDTMELLADNGNGQFAYIDSEREARKVLIEELGGTLYTIAKDVKVQVEFNPIVVKEYALIGYDNRRLENHEFNDDSVDAGDIGAGHQVTALYLVKLQDEYDVGEGNLRYQETSLIGMEDELMYVKLRYKEPNGDESKLISEIIYNKVRRKVSDDFGFACVVAEFGLALRGDFEFEGSDYEDLYDEAMGYIIENTDAYKIEFAELVSKAAEIVH